MAALKSVKSVSPAKRKRQNSGDPAPEGQGKSKFGGFKKSKFEEGFQAKGKEFKPKNTASKFGRGKESRGGSTGENNFVKYGAGKSSSKFDKTGKFTEKFDKTSTFPKAEAKYDNSENNAPETRLDRKARKELAEHRKSLRRPNYELEKEVKRLWEKMRQRDLEKTARAKLVTEALAKMKGKMIEMATSHVSSRVLQSCLKHCSKPERDAVFEELRPHILALAKETYAYHIVLRMMDHADKTQLQHILSTLHGHVVSFLRHPVASAVIEHAYQQANGHQRKELVSEFYSPEFRLFKGVAVAESDGGLKEMMAKEPASKQNTMVQHMMLSIQPILEKGIVDHHLTHRALAEYLTVCKRSMVEDVVKSLTGPLLLRMIHTRDGARIAVTCINMSTAKERKLIIKSMKGHVKKIACDEYSSIVLMAILDLVDDTTLVSKVIVSELLKDLKEIISHKYGRRFVLHLLAPGEHRYFPVDILKLLEYPAGVCNIAQLQEAAETATAPVAEGAEPAKPTEKKKNKKVKNDVEAGDAAPAADAEPSTSGEKKRSKKVKKEEDRGDKETEEGDEAEEMDVEQGPKELRGVSKKDPAVRRQELLTGGGLGKKLVETCTESAQELLVSNIGTEVIYEVAIGGIDNVLWKIAGEELIALHKAIADLVAKSEVPTSTGAGDTNVMTQYFSSRTLRRLIVNSQGSPFDNKAPSFAAILYSDALKGKCNLWAKDHSAKVISAYTICKDERARKAASSEIKKLVETGVIRQQEKA
ncbi:hypothetical protein R1sor_000416 [Riccia sorocarpa]|uniref:PUM-HD domain-containing protein n=1 Tax=Riccia sorocarpa TaxID=122646 RepID=A0ABD3GVJ1_9MARC